MRPLHLLPLAIAATADMTCTITGGGDGLCRTCPATGCAIIGTTPDGQNRTFGCVWPLGEDVSGNKAWMWDKAANCFLAQSRTNCLAVGNLVGNCFVSAPQGAVKPPRGESLG